MDMVVAVTSTLQPLVKAQAVSAGVDPALACAIVEQESSWNPWAIRFEPAFKVRYVDPKGLDPTEATARSFSWGLFQLMGEVAREHGYKGALPALCDPLTGSTWGLIHFKSRLATAGGHVETALFLWNGGGNPQYAAEVMARIGKYR